MQGHTFAYSDAVTIHSHALVVRGIRPQRRHDFSPALLPKCVFCVYIRWHSPQDTRPQCNSPPRKGLLPLQTADTPHDRTFEESALLVYSSHAFVSSTMQRPNRRIRATLRAVPWPRVGPRSQSPP